MPTDEITDFEVLWADSMIDSGTGAPRVPGGPAQGGVNYEPLCDWSCGNAMSIDPRTDSTARDVMDFLVNKLRASLRYLDVDPSRHVFNQSAGLTGEDMKGLFGPPIGKKTRTRGVGQFNSSWVTAERILQYLVATGHVRLYANKNTIATAEETQVLANVAANIIPDNEDAKRMIVGNLLSGKRRDAHVRLNIERGWETYIRDYFGAPDGHATATPGNLGATIPVGTVRTMSVPVHEVFALTWSRANAQDSSSWSTVQYEVKRILTSEVIGNGTNRIPLDRYYEVFTQQRMGFMSDYCLGQVADSTSRNNFTLLDLGGTPRQWEVEFEPALLRWRVYHRTRGRVI